MSLLNQRDPAWEQALQQRLDTRNLGHPLLAFHEVTSTSDLVKDLAIEGAPEGLTVVARTQQSGRGRRGRPWISLPDKGVYLSLLFRPRLKPHDMGWLAILGGVAVAELLDRQGLRDIAIKWPNDILVRGRKIAGILVERRIGDQDIEFVVVGIGVNLDHAAADWQGTPLDGLATSCRMEGVTVSRDDAIIGLLDPLEKMYEIIRRENRDEVFRLWSRWGGGPGIPPIT